MVNHHTTDIVVIGAGPVGLFTVFECGMLKLKCHVVDTLDMIGGQCSALYPEKPIYDIPAHPTISGQGLIENLSQQIHPFKPTFHLCQQVTAVIPRQEGRFDIQTSKGTSINAGAIIIAAGVGAFGPNRPPLDQIEEYEGKSIFYYINRREDFRGKKVLIAGGGDSAVDWALSLSEIAEVTLLHRRAKFRAAPESVDRLHALAHKGQIKIQTPYQLHGLQGKDGMLDAVEVATLDGQTHVIETDCLLPFYGLSMNLGPILTWGLELENKHIKVRQDTCQTNIPGIFAVGDIASYPGKLKLILTGFAEAAHAAYHARAYLHPHEVFHFEYSTTQGLPSL